MTALLSPPRSAPAQGGDAAASCAESARRAYDALAPAYDAFTAEHAYDRVLALVERLARAHGMQGRRLLDVACGTGRSFEPMLARGYDVTACDLSPAMVDRARRRLGPARAHRALVADMRALPDLGRFDLVTCLDDAVNYLHSVEDLDAAFASVARALAPDGVYVFDVNTLRTYRRAFAETWRHADPEVEVTVVGETSEDVAPGSLCSARMHVRLRSARGWRRRTCVHVQRHWPEATLLQRLRRAGLGEVVAHGLRPGPELAGAPDELLNHKVLFVARRGELDPVPGRS